MATKVWVSKLRFIRFGLKKRYFALISLILFIIIFGYFNDYVYYDILHLQYDCFTSQQRIDDIAYTIHQFHWAAQKTNFTYWLLYGSLLGAYKKKEILPWDYDGDIGFLTDHRQPLRSAIPRLLEQFQITVHLKRDSGYQLKYHDVLTVDLYPHRHHQFVQNSSHKYEYDNNTIFRTSGMDFEILGNGCGQMHYDDVFPIKQCEFHAKHVNCPSRPLKLLKNCYGIKTAISIPYKLDCWKPNKLFKIWGLIN